MEDFKINKDTKLYGSFSNSPGNLGCNRFNKAFKKNGINALYKSFGIENPYIFHEFLFAAKILKFEGFAISMPFKEGAYKKIDKLYLDEICKITKSVNCLKLSSQYPYEFGYNTDYFGIKDFFEIHVEEFNGKEVFPNVYIVGMGAFARTANLVFSEKGKNVYYINSRSDKLQNVLNGLECGIIFNASPVKNLTSNESCLFIDCDTNTPYGKRMSFYAAKHQFYDVYGFDRKYIFEEVD